MNSSVAVQRICACGELATIRLNEEDVCSTCAISYLPRDTRPVSDSGADGQTAGGKGLSGGPSDSTKPTCHVCGAPAITVSREGHLCAEHRSNKKRSKNRL